MLKYFFKKKNVKIGDFKLVLDLTNPHEKKYYQSIKNDDYYISQRLVKKGDRVLDLGANIGFTALLYLSFGANKVYAFEPVSALYKRILAIKTNDIEAYNIALSNYEGESEIYLSSSHNQGHSLNTNWPNKFKDVFKNKLTETVKVSTLDRVLPNEKFNFIKIDVEGMEKETILGGPIFFKENYNAIVQIEIYDWQFKETHSLMSKYYSKAYVPILNENKVIEFRDLETYKNINEIKFIGPPNYIYSNNELI